MNTRNFLGAAAFLALLSAGCSDSGSSRSTTPVIVDGRVPTFTATASAPKVILPTGKGIDVATDPLPPGRTKNRIEYHNGQLQLGTQDLYLVLYGSWGNPDTSSNVNILSDVVMHCPRPYTDIFQAYTDYAGRAPNGCFIVSLPIVDAYSHGTTLSDADVVDVVRQQLDAGALPEDPVGIYVVVTSADVAESSGFGTSYCAWHSRFLHQGIPLHLGFIGWPERAPAACAPNGVGPNGTVGADAAVSHLWGILSGYLTDPEFNGWYDKLGLEMADKCVWTFGTTYAAANGAKANVHFGTRDFLLQQLWVPGKNGGTCGLHP
jgi:phosphate-induced protein 1